MTTQERTELLHRLDAADRWLTRIYDPTRSVKHRCGLWNFLMRAADPKLKQILVTTRLMDEQSVNYWDSIYGRN